MDTSAILWGALTIALTACGWMGAFIFQRSVRLGERADNRIELTSEKQGGVLAELAGIRAELKGMRSDLTRIEETRASKESVEHLFRDMEDLKTAISAWGPAFQSHQRTIEERLIRLTSTAAPTGKRENILAALRQLLDDAEAA